MSEHIILAETFVDEEYWGETYFAQVTFTDKDIERILHLMDMLDDDGALATGKAHSDILCIERWHPSATVFPASVVPDDLQDEIYDEEYLIRDTPFKVDDDDVTRTDMHTARVYSHGVQWGCYLKHTSVRITITEIFRQDLEKLLEADKQEAVA